MNKIVLSLISLVSLYLSGMQEASFSRFSELPRDMRHLTVTHALDKNNILQSLRNLRLVNKDFNNFLSQDSLTRQNSIKQLAENLDVSPRAIALHVIKLFKLKPESPVAQRLLKDNPVDKGLDRMFINAVIYGFREQVQSLLKQGADVNAQDDTGWTALMWAVENDNDDMIKLLLNAGADSNIKDKDGVPALEWARHYDRKNIIPLLLDAGSVGT